MSITYSEYVDSMIAESTAGYIVSFNVGTVGAIPFDSEVTDGALSVVVKPGPLTYGSTAMAGISVLPGGRVFSPFSRANKRAPVPYSSYTQTIIYVGHIAHVMRQYQRLLALVGGTGRLTFSFGRTTSGTITMTSSGQKWCNAILTSVSILPGDLPLDVDLHPKKTARQVSATWQQVGGFTAV